MPAVTTTPGPLPGGPVAQHERIALLDVLRGFAIFGIVLVKAADFSPDFWDGWPFVVDRLAGQFEQHFLADKFWTLFSFLFGVGFALQLQRSAARDESFPRLYVRRLLALLAIGLLHGLLLWSGDILSAYALLGLLLLAFRTARDRTIFAALVLMLILPPTVTWLHREVLATPPLAELTTAEAIRLYTEGPALAIWRHEATETLIYLRRGIIGPGLWTPGIFMLFLLGLYAGRHSFVQRLGSSTRFGQRVLIAALLATAAGKLALLALAQLWPAGLLPYLRMPLDSLFWYVHTLGLSSSYAALLALLLLRPGWSARLAPLAAVGRTALSNYLLQSVVFVLIYYSYGLGLYGSIRPATALLISVAVFAAELALSSWWLRRFRFGPVEWLWRSLTWGRLQPMQTGPAPRPAPALRQA